MDCCYLEIGNVDYVFIHYCKAFGKSIYQNLGTNLTYGSPDSANFLEIVQKCHGINYGPMITMYIGNPPLPLHFTDLLPRKTILPYKNYNLFPFTTLANWMHLWHNFH